MKRAAAPPLVLARGDVEWRRADGRIYGITETKSLFGEHALMIAWGRRGRLQHRLETFDSEEEMQKRRRELAARRHRHGYEVVA